MYKLYKVQALRQTLLGDLNSHLSLNRGVFLTTWNSWGFFFAEGGTLKWKTSILWHFVNRKIQIQAWMLMTRFWTHEDSEGNWQICYCQTEIEVTVIASKNLAIYNSTCYVSLTMTWFQGKKYVPITALYFSLPVERIPALRTGWSGFQPCKMSPMSRQKLFHSKHKMDLYSAIAKMSLVFCWAPADIMIV